jgi:hypothetical protein
MKRIAALAAALLCCGCGASTLDAHAFKKDAETLQSVAAESALVAGQVAEGEGTATFTRVHTEYLGKDAETLATTLTTASAPAGLKRKRAKAARLARRLHDDIAELHAAPDDRALAARLHGDFLETADAAEQLAQ